jgi:hypothetical protein
MTPLRREDRRNQDDSIDRELGFHIDALTQDYIAQGMDREEARRRARLEFGGAEQVKQTVREVHASAWIEAVLFNLRAAMRFLRKSPSFSLVIILTLALGIGANSAVFSAIDAVVLRPLRIPMVTSLSRWRSMTLQAAPQTISSLPFALRTGAG